MCIGGKTDNKNRCYIWKHKQPLPDELVKIADDISKGIISSDNFKYRPNIDCFHDIGSLFTEEMYIKDRLDKDLDDRK